MLNRNLGPETTILNTEIPVVDDVVLGSGKCDLCSKIPGCGFGSSPGVLVDSRFRRPCRVWLPPSREISHMQWRFSSRCVLFSRTDVVPRLMSTRPSCC